ncbi:helix-turn-helix transcriptional regulator [Paraglaciecola arctica]|uniref:Transcriptional regulator, XRE family n=1 Tax=Paraglaciecola arctica BSs20135 TaxID=493475 RepID=K6YKL7_9ALTE|nr:helix-turn-helix transcriptional regulator [Paraglaciecola arctica]GAC17163.1 transcriptional regulator, XRE family [Paraglaciecola arctica BSs20135]
MELLNKLKIHRAVHNLTQAELALKVGVSRKTINTVENGIYIPSTVLALKIAEVLNVTVEDIFSLKR